MDVAAPRVHKRQHKVRSLAPVPGVSRAHRVSSHDFALHRCCQRSATGFIPAGTASLKEVSLLSKLSHSARALLTASPPPQIFPGDKGAWTKALSGVQDEFKTDRTAIETAIVRVSLVSRQAQRVMPDDSPPTACVDDARPRRFQPRRGCHVPGHRALGPRSSHQVMERYACV